MNKKIILLSALMAAGYGLAAQVKDVSFGCGKNTCDVTFKFADAKSLPGYFQKYNAATGKWTVAFAKSDFALGEGSYVVDDLSNGLKEVSIFKENGRQGELLKFEWSTGTAVQGDNNAVSLNGAEFKISLPNTKAKAWKLSSVISAQKKAAEKAALEAEKNMSAAEKKKAAEEKKAALAAEKEAKKKAEEEKKAALEREKAEKILAAEQAKAEKARKDSLAKAEKAAKLAAEKEAKIKAAEEKKAALAQAKAEKAKQDSLAKAEKAAKLAAEKEAKKKAEEEKKAALAQAKAEKARKDSLAKAEKAAKLAAEKEAKLRAAEEKKAALEREKAEKALALEQAKAEKARKDSLVKALKAVSALIDGVAEMTSVTGFGLDQFSIKMLVPLSLDKVTYSDKKNTVTLAVTGPEKSPLLKVNAGSFVKSLAWTKEGLVLQLSSNARPKFFMRDGALTLQSRESVATEGFLYWKALPNGIHTRRWVKPTEDVIPASVDEFAARFEKDSKKPVTAAQSFFLTSLARELIVTADETELYEHANDNSTVLARLNFGDKLESIDIVGLYHKVQNGPRVGFVDKRAVSYRDELSAVQSERLKQLAVLNGETEDSPASKGFSFDNDDRVMYSSFGRRDPFVDVKGLVEEGINIDQMELVGIIWESEEPMAILSDVKNSSVSYTLKEGDKVLNGKVLKITQTDVLFLIQEFGVSRRYSMGLPDKFGGKK